MYVRHEPWLGSLDEHAALQECRRLLSETVAGRAPHPGVELHHEVLKGHPVQLPAEASAQALGLVLGTRGHGGFGGMPLGSGSRGTLHHAHRPVPLVPHRREPWPCPPLRPRPATDRVRSALPRALARGDRGRRRRRPSGTPPRAAQPPPRRPGGTAPGGPDLAEALVP
ncbi:universal stress protein [Streptomyces sp. NPDC058739]|uniref:universal stress protein n=1 Tax=Streptomyces sp. NPDC058739 TaxID=3346618 RepID=UPI0036BBE605